MILWDNQKFKVAIIQIDQMDGDIILQIINQM